MPCFNQRLFVVFLGQTGTERTTMKIELYKLDKPQGVDLKSRISRIHAQNINARCRTRTGGLMRLEALEKRGALWLMDFVKIRLHHGPSKAGENCPAQGFELEQSEGFGEETAMLWNSSNDWCVLQYNHGVILSQTFSSQSRYGRYASASITA